ncbi:hypothetical protein L1049_002919 [Liquidambar formosana]|uniref:Uncharacterized protein n=1 Tax=Liquidambar formosana TaxID=63359 RepID=A0AAP0NI44_LIQFO
MSGGGGLFFVVDQLAYSSMATAYITIMHGQICQVSCKPHSSLGTWLAFAMVSFSCSELSVSVRPCFLSATFIGLSSASSKLAGLRYVWKGLCDAHIFRNCVRVLPVAPGIGHLNMIDEYGNDILTEKIEDSGTSEEDAVSLNLVAFSGKHSSSFTAPYLIMI